MESQHIVIVGNSFKQFGEKNLFAITKEDFLSFCHSDVLTYVTLYIGQGITAIDVKEIEKEIARSKNSGRLTIANTHDLTFVFDEKHQQSVHKRKPENVIISPPLQLSTDRYASSIHFQNECSELSDYMTGQHIQGMALTEAARQMMLSVSERYLLRESLKGKAYFILHSIDVKFKKFMFPIESNLDFFVQKIQEKRMGTILVNSRTVFYQNDSEVAVIDIGYTAYHKDFISEKEDQLASLTLDKFSTIARNSRVVQYA